MPSKSAPGKATITAMGMWQFKGRREMGMKTAKPAQNAFISFTASMIIAAVALTSCNETEGGQGMPDESPSSIPPAADQSSEGSTTQAADLLAPPVEEPKEVDNVDTCTLFTTEDASRLGYDPAGIPEDGAAGTEYASCTWRPSGQRDGGVTIWADVERNGISEMYRLPRETYPDFREFEVAGYPSVQASLGESTDSSYFIHVGIYDTQFVSFGSSIGIWPGWRSLRTGRILR
ncbi:putative DUF3558 family protein [Actinoalloteichus fjordicus]|uniref:DUF3558 family protein n=2 Tax=Actinoalloteichus fjordicus TaxID=1612552 RepID=A0AAC9LI87_9PSEU|nr:putative DUF3558 family protein [Actinoalloteichus fjordicus]